MGFNFASDKPIFLQIAELVKLEIISGKLKAGEKLKSVRDFSAELGVNPNTVQKALSELESQGLIFTDRTNGKFVANDSLVVKSEKKKLVLDKVKSFVNDMKNMGFEMSEIIEMINKQGEKND